MKILFDFLFHDFRRGRQFFVVHYVMAAFLYIEPDSAARKIVERIFRISPLRRGFRKFFPRFFVAVFIIESVLVFRDFFNDAFAAALHKSAFIANKIGVFVFKANPEHACFDLQRFFFIVHTSFVPFYSIFDFYRNGKRAACGNRAGFAEAVYKV